MCMFNVLPLNSSHSCSCTVMMYTTYMSGISAQIRRGWNTNLPYHSTTQLQSDLCISTCYVSLTTARDNCKFSCGPSSLYCNQNWKSGVKCPAQILGEQNVFKAISLRLNSRDFPTVVSLAQHFTNRKPQSHALPHSHMPQLIVTCLASQSHALPHSHMPCLTVTCPASQSHAHLTVTWPA